MNSNSNSNNKSNFQSHVQNSSNSYNKNFTRNNHSNANQQQQQQQQYPNQMQSRTMPMSVAQQSHPSQHGHQQQQVAAAAAAAAQYEMFHPFSNQMRQSQQASAAAAAAAANHHANKSHAPQPNYMLNPHLAAAAAHHHHHHHQAHHYQPFYGAMPANYAMPFQQMFQLPGPIATAPPPPPHHSMQPPLVPMQPMDAIQHAQLQQQQQQSNTVSTQQTVPTQTAVSQSHSTQSQSQTPATAGVTVTATAATAAAKKKSTPIRIRAPDQETNMKFDEWFEQNSTKVNNEADIRSVFNQKVHEKAAEDNHLLATAAAVSSSVTVNARSSLVGDAVSDKTTPTVSANSEGAEITITNKSSKRDQQPDSTCTSPIRSHSKKMTKAIVITSATDSAVVSIASLAGESAIAAEAAAAAAATAPIVVTPEASETKVTPTQSSSSSHNHTVTPAADKGKVTVLSTGAAVDAVAAVTSGVRSPQQTMPAAVVVESVVPEKALSKTGREKDLNMRGDLLLMQGSDFDAFDFNEKLSVVAPKEKQTKPVVVPAVTIASATATATTATATTVTATSTKKAEKKSRDLKSTDLQLQFVASANKIAPLPDIAKPKAQNVAVPSGSTKSKSKTPAAAASIADNKKSNKTSATAAASQNQKPKAPSPTILPSSQVTKDGKQSSAVNQKQAAQQKVTAKKETVASGKPAQTPVQQPPQPSHKKTLTDMSTGAVPKAKFDVTNIVMQMQTSSGAIGKKPVIPVYQQPSIEQSTEPVVSSAVVVPSGNAGDLKSPETCSAAVAVPSALDKVEFPIAFKNPASGAVIVFTAINVYRKYTYVGINTPMGTSTPKRYTIEFAFEVTGDKRCDWTPDYKFKSDCGVLRRTSKTRALPSARVPHYQFSGSRGSTGNSRQMGGGNKGSYSMSGRNSMQNMASVGGGYQPKISLKLDLDEDVKLNTAENAWKPSVLKSKQSTGTTETAAAAVATSATTDTSSGAKLSEKHEQICKQIRSILNKLTAQNFEKLTKEALNCDISNEENLIETVCNLIYDKAITEACFSESYANFCLQLSQSKIGESSSADYATNKLSIFRKSLVARCQREFERKETIYDKLKEIEACTNPAEKRQMQLNFEEEERKVRRRTNGNIRFLGELYKVSLLNCNVMLQCIKTKLAVHEDHMIESLCKLITVVGEKLESESKSNEMNECFNTIHKLIRAAKSEGIGQRVKFMMQDLVDLRNNKWKYVKAPKQNPLPFQSSSNSMVGLSSTSSGSMSAYASQSSGPNQYNNQKRMTKPSSSLSAGIGSTSSGGSNSLNNNSSSWQTVSSSSSSAVSKSKSSNLSSVRNQNLDTMKLGPGDFNWSTGSKINDKLPTSTITGRSSLSATVPSSSATSSSLGPFSSATAAASSSKPVNSTSSYRPPPRLQSSSIENKSRNNTSKNLPSVPLNPMPVPSATAATATTATPIPVKINFDNTIKDMFAHCNSGMELSRDPNFREVIEKATPAVFIEKFLMYMFEKTKVNFEVASRMLNEMLQKQWLAKTDVLNCLTATIIPNLPMLLDDAPYASEYLMRILAESVFAKIFTLQDLKKTIFDTIQMERECYKCFRALIAQFMKREKDGANLLRSIWNVQKYDVLDLIAKSFLPQFKETAEAKFFNDCLSSSDTSTTTNNQNSADLMKCLIECLRTDSDPFDKTIDWIRTNMGVSVSGAAAAASNDTDSIKALKMLVIAICRCSIVCKNTHDNDYTVNKTLIKEQWKIVRKYFNSNYEEKSEVICLNAIVEFMNSVQHPKGVWNEISDVLYEGELISVNAFLAWRDENDQMAGRGVAMSSLGHFFQLLSGQFEKDDELDDIVDKVKNTNC